MALFNGADVAARKTRGTRDNPWSEEHRKRISTSMLLNRLEKHALGKVDLSATQVRAVEILLKKSVPDLQAIQIGGDDKNPVKMVIEWQAPSE